MKTKPVILILSTNQELIGILMEHYKVEPIASEIENTSEETIARLLNNVTPDLIIIDVRKPSIEKFKLSLGIRRMHDIPLLMVSSWETQGKTIRLIDIKAYDSLSGPIDEKNFLAKIENIFLKTGINRN